MTVPFVTAFSASCSTKGTVAPRPATSAGSRPARVTGVGVGVVAYAVPAALTTRPRPTRPAVAAVAQRGRLNSRNIDGLFLIGRGAPGGGTDAGSGVTIEFL